MWSYQLSLRCWGPGSEGARGRAGLKVGEELAKEGVAHLREGLTQETVTWLWRWGRGGSGAQVMLWWEGLAATEGPQ